MSTAPLNRDEQIGLMQNAKSRLESLVQTWKDNETVSEILREPHADLTDGHGYSRSDGKLERIG
jgi:hypothetical protein